MRPCGFEKARSQKPLKKSQILSKMPEIERFFVSRYFKTWWSHLGPRDANSRGSSWPVDPLGHPGGVLIVKIQAISFFVMIFCDESAPWWLTEYFQNHVWSLLDYIQCQNKCNLYVFYSKNQKQRWPLSISKANLVKNQVILSTVWDLNLDHPCESLNIRKLSHAGGQARPNFEDL